MSEWLNVGAGCDTHTRVLRSPGHAMTHCLPHPVASLSPHTLSLSSHTLTHASSRSHSLRLSSSHSPYQISISHLPHTQHSPLPSFSHIQDTSLFFLNWKHKYKDKHGHKNVRTPSTLDIQMEVFWQQGREARAAVKVRSYPLHSLSSPHLMGISNNNWAKFCGHVPFAHTTFLLVL